MRYTIILLIIISIGFISCGETKKDNTIQQKDNNQAVETGDKRNEKEIKQETVEKEVIEKHLKPAEQEKTVNRKLEATAEEAQDKLEEKKEDAIIKEPFNHNMFDELLNAYVMVSGEVSYAAFKTEQGKLKAYLKLLKENTPQQNWKKNEQLAYWINLYNAHTINLILNNYPVKSIMDINNGKPWDLKVATVDGKKYSLNEIENDIIRPVFKEPRIHFAVNCAAISCPKLLNNAFMPESIELQLEKQTKAFINNTKKNKIDVNTVVISKIFDWYKADFEKNGTLIEFLNQYNDTKIDSKATISFQEYIWNLNE